MNETVDTATGEIIETPEFAIVPVKELAIQNFQGIAQQAFSENKQKKLLAPIRETDIEILPEGILYLPQIKTRRILNDTFGPGAWAIRRLSVSIKDDVVMFDGELWIEGRYIAGSTGEQKYQATNKRMTYAQAIEGAKSDCLTRCCKDLGIASELWDPQYIESWKAKNAAEIWCVGVGNNNKNDKKKLWRKNNAKPFEYPWKEGATESKKEPSVVGDVEQKSKSSKAGKLGNLILMISRIFQHQKEENNLEALWKALEPFNLTDIADIEKIGDEIKAKEILDTLRKTFK